MRVYQFQTSGYSSVFMSLRGVEIPNNSYVNVDDIGGLRGPTTEGLFCHTDAFTHGKWLNHGVWYFPNGSQVWHYSQFLGLYEHVPGTSFEVGSDFGLIRLFTRGTPSERGLFHCKITDASGVNQTLFVTIGESHIFIYIMEVNTYISKTS